MTERSLAARRVERRRAPRRRIDASVILSHPAFGRIKARALDISDGGLYVDTAYHVAPPIGAIVEVIIKRHAGAINATPVSMQVVNRRERGLGLRFVQNTSNID